MLSPTSSTPLYEQIKQQITQAILSGSLQEGDALPSLRVLARELEVSLITTTRAYNDLAAAGLIHNLPGRGSVVAAVEREKLLGFARARITEYLDEAIGIATTSGLKLDELVSSLEHTWRLRHDGKEDR